MPRAKPLSAADRQAAIVAAAIPLISAVGRTVTTRQLAEAAGVAEGTLFRVFPDKDAIIDAVIAAIFDPTPLIAAIDALPPEPDLGTRITELATIVHRRATEAVTVVVVLGLAHTATPSAEHIKHIDQLVAAIADALEPYAGQLALTPRRVADFLRILVLGASTATLHADTPPTINEICDLLLSGIRKTS